MATPTCIIALNQIVPPSSNGTMAINGGAIVTAHNCDVDDDSTSAKSINSNGGGTIRATNVYTRGGIDGSVNVTAVESVTTHGSYIVPDPYASYAGQPAPRSIPPLPAFRPSSENSWGQNNQTVNITNPTGVKAYQGKVTVKGTVNLAPGVYIIADGDFESTGNNNILNGTGGVTIVLTTTTGSGGGTFKFSGGVMHLTAPSSGTTAGIALWADRRLTLDASDNFVGGSTNGITGAIYLPSHLVKFAGNQAAVTRCTQLIADQITFTGTPTYNHDCAGVGILDPVIILKPSSSSSSWSLVE